jgi:agmatine deiminase
MRLLRELLPGRPIIGIDAFDFAWGLGAWHCASQQQPLAGG